MKNNNNKNQITPFQKIDFNLINRVTFEAWPEGHFNCIEDIELIKKFYNDSYKNLENRLEKELEKYHPAGWILEAYKQLELWTVIFHGHSDQVTGIKKLAPQGRYGWRYIIEKSMEILSSDFKFSDFRPAEESSQTVITILFAMSQVAEFSNYFHYFGDKLSSAKLLFSPTALLKVPDLSESESKLFDQLLLSIFEKNDDDIYSDFLPTSEIVEKKADEFLKDVFSITLDDIQLFIEEGLLAILSMIHASITVQPLDEFVGIIHKKTNLSIDQILSIMSLCFYRLDVRKTQSRDFLRKSQQDRMLNFAGLIIELTEDYETIYDEKTVGRIYDEKQPFHVIISTEMAIDWMNAFVPRLVLGQRTDLKSDEELKNKLADLESFYHKNIFESQVTGLLQKQGFHCFNLSKVDRKLIECGEIDILAFLEATKELIIVECKALSPAVDARGLGQIISDHYNQKKYHKKFLRKIKWVQNNTESLSIIIQSKFSIQGSIEINKISPFFITCYNNAIGLFENNYKYMTYYEFDKHLANQS